MFEVANIENLNETDVREQILAPLIRKLGYKSGTENNVIREQFLKYPKLSLGRKNQKDPLLRGKADYILEAYRKVNWVMAFIFDQGVTGKEGLRTFLASVDTIEDKTGLWE